MRKWLHNYLSYNFLQVIIFVICSFIASPSFASQDVSAQISNTEKVVTAAVKTAYNDSWQEFTEQDVKSSYPFHFQHVEAVVDSHMSCDKPMSNTASFGITLYGKENQPIGVFSFGFPISSGAVKKSFESKCILSKTIIEKLEQKYITFFTEIFKLNPSLKKTYTEKFKDIIEFIDGANSVAERARRPAPKIDGLANDRTYGSDINSFLHCEQAVIIDLLFNQNSDFIKHVQQEASRIEKKENISKITFDIITYNDMCPQCFSTCFSARDQLIQKIRETLGIDKSQEIEFQIIISSFRPYGIHGGLQTSLDGKKHTRGINSHVMDDSFITKYARNRTVGNYQISDRPINRSMHLIQLINPFCVKTEVPLTLTQKRKDITAIKQDTAIPITLYASHTSEIAELMQFYTENNIVIEPDTLKGLQTFSELISPYIQSIQAWLHSASQAMKQLPKSRPSTLIPSLETDIQLSIPIRGLTNIGNTCYFNSAMQALCAVQMFQNIIQTISTKKMPI